MAMHHETSSLERTITVPFTHRVYFTRSVFTTSNPLLTNVLSGKEAKALVVLDMGVAVAFPDLPARIEAYFSSFTGTRLAGPVLILPGGEAAKKTRDAFEQILASIEKCGIDRHSYVVAIGGGALLDVAGFAAAVAHRGVRHVRVPTTTLSQADGGVGVKNGINLFGKKNFAGTFAVPHAVINDSDFLVPLPVAEKRGGLIEAIKVALIRDAAFFEEIERTADSLARFEIDELERVVRRCAELHVQHIAEGGDPFEFGSARPLDFGHWAAHKLEQMSGFTISHGAAVALGVILDTHYSVKAGLLAPAAADRVTALIGKLGFAAYDPLMADPALLNGLDDFREHLGGQLTITLLADIGRGVEVHEINRELMCECIAEMARHR